MILQDKVATKIRKKENTIRNLTTECERIRAKAATEELTAGQASTLARNERTIDLLKEEVGRWAQIVGLKSCGSRWKVVLEAVRRAGLHAGPQ